ncbi:MAG: TrmH family RNA methyltransferase [Bacteroidia bacterium]
MESLSRAKIKLFSSLQQKKYRERHKRFLIEGKKLYEEAIHEAWEIEAIIIPEGEKPMIDPDKAPAPVYLTPPTVFKRMSSQVSPEGPICVLIMPESTHESIQNELLPEGPGLLIAGLQDPGNLGTIMRTADWLGFKDIVFGPDTVDVWNYKCLRASMGSIFRLQFHQISDWPSFLSQQKTRIWVADMEGTDLGDAVMGTSDWLLVGNEANGISEDIRAIDRLNRVTIPRHGGGESLNVAIATAILAWKLRSA